MSLCNLKPTPRSTRRIKISSEQLFLILTKIKIKIKMTSSQKQKSQSVSQGQLSTTQLLMSNPKCQM
jgi:hypothetical protein